MRCATKSVVQWYEIGSYDRYVWCNPFMDREVTDLRWCLTPAVIRPALTAKKRPRVCSDYHRQLFEWPESFVMSKSSLGHKFSGILARVGAEKLTEAPKTLTHNLKWLPDVETIDDQLRLRSCTRGPQRYISKRRPSSVRAREALLTISYQ